MSQYHVNSRFEKRDKRRKTNIVLNSLIGIVLVLILFIGSQLIFGGEAEKTAQYNEQPDIKLANKQDVAEKEQAKEDNQDESSNEDLIKEEEASTDPFEQATITEGDPGSGIEEIIENPGWKPVGTSQTEPHAANYDKNSQDWAEMKKALSYATGIPESEMIIWYLGNNGSPHDAVGTISPKDKSAKYKVYITWVESKGWKPTKIEKVN